MSTEPNIESFLADERVQELMDEQQAESMPEELLESVEAALAQPPVQANADIMAMFAQLLASQNDANREMFLAGIAEMRKPDAAAQKKLDEEKVRSMQLTMNRIAAAQKEELGKAERIANCSHTKPNGKTNLRGQVHSNTFAKVYCSYCGYNSPYFAAMPHEINGGGLGTDSWGPNAFAIVQSRVRNSPATPPPVPDIPFGASITFN